MLPVSAPFHCSLMKPAQDRLAADLAAVQFRKPGIPVACNVDAALVDDSRSQPGMRWCARLLDRLNGSNPCICSSREGWSVRGSRPGKVLCGLMRQIDRSKTALNVGDEASLQKTLEQFAAKRKRNRTANLSG